MKRLSSWGVYVGKKKGTTKWWEINGGLAVNWMYGEEADGRKGTLRDSGGRQLRAPIASI